MTPALQRLRAEIRFDREAFEQRSRESEDLPLDAGPTPAETAQAAVALH